MNFGELKGVKEGSRLRNVSGNVAVVLEATPHYLLIRYEPGGFFEGKTAWLTPAWTNRWERIPQKRKTKDE